MTRKTKSKIVEIMKQDKDGMKEIIREYMQEVLESEMSELIGAGSYERNGERKGYRSGYYSRSLVTRVGKIELRIPQDREGRFSTELFERYQRTEQALVLALMQMYVHGVSTRKVKAITEELCGHEFSASTVSRLNKNLDERLRKFSRRRLDEEEYPYLMLDARYERVREDGVVRRRAVLVAIGIGWDGRRHILGVELANNESKSTWSEFLRDLVNRGLHGVEFVVSDHHEGLRQAIVEVLPQAFWQRCYVHFLRNAKDHLHRNADRDCLLELRRVYGRYNIEEARRDLSEWLAKWSEKYPKICLWVEDSIEETLTFYRLPQSHHKHMRSTNLVERLNQELKRRTHIVRIFPNAESCWRLILALGAEQHEEWQEGAKYMNMVLLKEFRKDRMRKLETEAA